VKTPRFGRREETMMNNLFEKALSIDPPWFVKEIRFDEGQKQLDIYGSSSFRLPAAGRSG
jgi:hypothetical protein